MDPELDAFDRYRKESLDRYIKESGLDDLVIICFRRPGPFENPTPDLLPDDVDGDCDKCGERIYYRPYIPSVAIKWCVDCADEEAKSDPDLLSQIRQDANNALRYLHGPN